MSEISYVEKEYAEKPSEELVVVFWGVIRYANDLISQNKRLPEMIGKDLRLIIAEFLKRGLFTHNQMESRPVHEIWTFYKFVKQYIEGVSRGDFEPIDSADDQYVNIVHELQDRGETMPSQRIEAEYLDLGINLLKKQEIRGGNSNG